MHIQRFTPKLALLATLALTAITIPAAAQDLLWIRQAGTSDEDRSNGVAVDSAGNSYITGQTYGDLGGPNAGSYDYFVAKYDASGSLLWMRQAGTSSADQGIGVGLDSAGNVFIVGATGGDLAGPNAGNWDVFLAKYDASGSLLWTRQFGSSRGDRVRGVAVDSVGSSYITGYTEGSLAGPFAGGFRDVFVAKFDASGTLLWMHQFGTQNVDEGSGVAVDSAGNAYITGHTSGDLGAPSAGAGDVFLAKFDTSGTLLWIHQFGTSTGEYGTGVAVDSAGSVYITGAANGSFGGPSAGRVDVFLAKFDTSGTLLWTRQAGTSGNDLAHGVAVDGAGHAYVIGRTQGSFGGPSAGNWDVFVAKFDSSGVPLWTRQIGTPEFEEGLGIAMDSAGNAYITGSTLGSLGGPSAGSQDLFLAKYGEACYADCDQSTGVGVLDLFDFLCFQNSFVNSEPYACDCDTTTGPLVCDLFDFLCFQNAFVAGCP